MQSLTHIDHDLGAGDVVKLLSDPVRDFVYMRLSPGKVSEWHL